MASMEKVNIMIHRGDEMNIYVGVDVSKGNLDIQLVDEYFTVTNDNKGIKNFIQQLRAKQKQGFNIVAVVFEASGGYERLLLKSLLQAKYPYRLAHANHVRNFAKATGRLAKTDKLDAELIRDYAQYLKITAEARIYSEITEEIKSLIKRREQLIDDRTRENNRLETCHPKLRQSLESHIRWLNKSIKEIEKALEELSKHEDVKEDYDILMSTPSVGFVMASALLGYLPELGKMEHKSLSALVGVAPYNHDSGKHIGQRYIKGGRKDIRNYLYLAALSSLRWNKEFKIFYDKLRAKGKPAKVALTALMRKLLIVLNSLMKKRVPWQERIC